MLTIIIRPITGFIISLTIVFNSDFKESPHFLLATLDYASNKFIISLLLPNNKEPIYNEIVKDILGFLFYL